MNKRILQKMNPNKLVNGDNQTPRVSHRELDKPNPATSGISSSATGASSTHRVQPNEQDNRVSVLPPLPHARVDAVSNRMTTIQQFHVAGSSTKSSRKGAVVGRSARENSNRRHLLHGHLLPMEPPIFNAMTPQDNKFPTQPGSISSKVTAPKASSSSTVHAEVAGSTTKTDEKKTKNPTGDIKMMDGIIKKYNKNPETEHTDRYYRFEVIRNLRIVLACSGITTFLKLKACIHKKRLEDFMNSQEYKPSHDLIRNIRIALYYAKGSFIGKKDQTDYTYFENAHDNVENTLRHIEKMHGYSKESNCER